MIYPIITFFLTVLFWPASADALIDNTSDAIIVEGLLTEPLSSNTSDEQIILRTDRQSLHCGAGSYEMLNIDEQKRIVGGSDAVKNSWPSIVALLNNDRQFCGGSLMDSTHIITAAHCVAHMSSWDVSRLSVALGLHALKPKKDAEIIRKVRRVTRHKYFDSSTLFNDVAVLTLESPVDFTDTISPVCLPVESSDSFAGKPAAVIEWGALNEDGSQPSVLRQVEVITNEDCGSMYGEDAPDGIPDHILCAVNPEIDSCSDDSSGGPLLVQDDPGSPWIQAGIVSWGIGCAQPNYPGVYGRMESLMEWIIKYTKD